MLHLDAGGQVGRLRLDADRGVLLGEQAAAGDLAGDLQRHVDGDLLAATHGEQVDVLEDALDRMALDRLRDRELIGAIDVEREQHVHAAVLERLRELARRQRDVARVGSVAVDDGRDLAGAAGAAGAALAELGARLGGETDFGHGRNSFTNTDRFR